MRTTALIAMIVAGLGMSASALAQTTETTVETTPPPGPPVPSVTTTGQAVAPAPAPARTIPQLDERTALMVGRHTLKLGILAFEYGIIQHLSVGSDPPAWLLRTVANVWVPNLHFKFQFLDRDPVWLAAQASGYIAHLKPDGVESGNLVVVPLSLYASVRVHPRVYLHGEGTYVGARLFGTGNVTDAQLNGAAAARAVQTGLMVQVRLTRIFSLTATGRLQVYVSDVPFSGKSTLDPFTNADLNGQYTIRVQHPWEAIGGIAVLWKHFHLIVGAGYGNYFLPGLDISNPKKTFVPDASLSVVL